MKRFVLLAASTLGAVAAPAVGQDYTDHGVHGASSVGECEAEAERHRAMGHPVPEGQCEPAAEPAGRDEPTSAETGSHETMDHGAMDHGAMDHEPRAHETTAHDAMAHGTTDRGEAPDALAERSPPAGAGSGPARAADAIWGADAMRESRVALRREHGAMTTAGLAADRFEYRAREGGDGFLWDAAAWYGGDLSRMWIESEGEATFGEGVEQADVAVLYGRAISPWFDLQAGVRQDLTGPERTYLDLGIQGVAPYFLELEADVYLSTRGDVTASAEVELDQRITQRLILQPRAEIALAAQDVPELGIGTGVDTIEAGLRLRYEFSREFTPYIGVEQEWKLGRSADFVRAAGEAPSATNYVVGVRFWF